MLFTRVKANSCWYPDGFPYECLFKSFTCAEVASTCFSEGRRPLWLAVWSCLCLVLCSPFKAASLRRLRPDDMAGGRGTSILSLLQASYGVRDLPDRQWRTLLARELCVDDGGCAANLAATYKEREFWPQRSFDSFWICEIACVRVCMCVCARVLLAVLDHSSASKPILSGHANPF
jgi:hypothetical protein